MKIAGIMAVHDFPMDVECILDLLPRVDTMSIWLDQRAAHRRPEIKALLHGPSGAHLERRVIIDAERPWQHCSGWIWREPLIRALDDIRPAYVLQPDSDEKFPPEFNVEFAAFRQSGRDLLMCDYQMPTADGKWVPTIPKARHCKAIRWKTGLSFTPYRGYGKPNGQLSELRATSKILHYCFYTPELQAAKVATFTEARQTKFGRRLEKPPCISSA
jgi:hypothetical protein